MTTDLIQAAAYGQPDNDGGFGGTFPTDRFPYMDSSAALQAAAATAAAFETIIDTNDEDFSIVTAFQADLGLGDASTFRAVWGASTNVDTNGSFYQVSRSSPNGEARIFCRDDAGADLIGQSPAPDTTNPAYDGAVHLLQLYDTASGSTGTFKAKLDADAVDTLDASYSRAGVGQLDIYSIGCTLKGPTPTNGGSVLGWLFMHILVNADLESDGAAIYTAFNGGSSMLSKCNAAITAIEDAGHTANILYGEVYLEGNRPRYGTAAAQTGVVFAEPGIVPS